MREYYVYILTNNSNGTLYVGMTKNPTRRVVQHKSEKGSKFAAKYSVRKIVYIEECQNIVLAIKREKQLKRWRREWKVRLIEKRNPEWKNLFEDETREIPCCETKGAGSRGQGSAV